MADKQGAEAVIDIHGPTHVHHLDDGSYFCDCRHYDAKQDEWLELELELAALVGM